MTVEVVPATGERWPSIELDFAREHGVSAFEGHPVDTDALQASKASKASKVSGSPLFAGTAGPAPRTQIYTG